MKHILLRRSGALGDVILTTPIIRILKETNYDDNLYIDSGCAFVYERNPYLSRDRPPHIDFLLNLDSVYESSPKMHVIDAYLDAVFGHHDFPDKHTELFFGAYTPNPFTARITDWSKVIIIHPAVSWQNRTFSQAFWIDLVQKLNEEGCTTITVGSANDTTVPNATYDLRGRGGSIFNIAALMQRSAGFVTPDSGLLHVAGATDIPIVGLFTVARAEYRLPYRNGVLGDGCIVFKPDLDCYGCLADEQAPVTNLGCRRGDFKCVREMFNPQEIALKTLEKIIDKNL